MSAPACSLPSCVRLADIKVADLALCARHYKQHAGWKPMTPPACHTCKRSLAMDESAWASDWTVITPDGPRLETRYACDDCEAKR